MLSQSNHKKPKTTLCSIYQRSQRVSQKQLNQKQHTNLQTPTLKVSPRHSHTTLTIKRKHPLTQNGYKKVQSESGFLDFLQLVEKFTKGIQMQIHKSQHKSPKNTVELKLDGLMMHRLKEIKGSLPEYKHIPAETPNPQILRNQAKYFKNQHKKASANKSTPNIQKQKFYQRPQLLRRASKNKSVSHLPNLTSSELLRTVLNRNQELLRQKLQLQSDNKKVRLFYLNQIEHYKQQVRFVHQILDYQQLQLRQLRSSNIQSTQPNLTITHPFQLNLVSVLSDSPRQQQFNMLSTAHFAQDQNIHSVAPEVQNFETILEKTDKRLKQYEQLLIQLKAELQQKGSSLVAMETQIALLQDNLADLNERVQLKEEILQQRSQCLQELENCILLQRSHLDELSAKVNIMRDQAKIYQQNLDLVQNQVQFMQEQSQLLALQIEQLSTQKQLMQRTADCPANDSLL